LREAALSCEEEAEKEDVNARPVERGGSKKEGKRPLDKGAARGWCGSERNMSELKSNSIKAAGRERRGLG